MRLRAHQRAMETDEVCDRPLETFGADTLMFLEFYCNYYIACVLFRSTIVPSM